MNVGRATSGRPGLAVARSGKHTIQSVLKTFGVPMPKPELSGGFWQRYTDLTLEELLNACRSRYRELMKQAHPDVGGSHEAAAELTCLMEWLEGMFQRRGQFFDTRRGAPPYRSCKVCGQPCVGHSCMGCRRFTQMKGRKFRGAYRSNDKWRAVIHKTGRKQTYLGTFNTQEEAARAYDEASVREFGEIGRVNFPKSTVLSV